MTTAFYPSVFWHQEDDGTWTKLRLDWKDKASGRIKEITILETEISQEEYFKRKLANKL